MNDQDHTPLLTRLRTRAADHEHQAAGWRKLTHDAGENWEQARADDLRAVLGEIATLTARAERVEAELARLRAENAGLREALREMVYETTHLSPCRPDGAHDCRISPAALRAARAALSSEPQAAADGEIAATQLTRGNGDE